MLANNLSDATDGPGAADRQLEFHHLHLPLNDHTCDDISQGWMSDVQSEILEIHMRHSETSLAPQCDQQT